MEVLEVLDKRGENEITIEATVVTGFEFSALEECREKIKPSCIVQAQGRIFFNIDISLYSKVPTLRSVDNLYLVNAAFKKLDLTKEKEKDIEVMKELVGRIEWKDWVKRWAKVKGCNVDLEESGGGERGELKYRVTCHRSGTQHSFSSMEAACHFGGQINDTLGWKVDLTKYHLEVVLNIIDDGCYVCGALTEKSLHRRNIVEFSYMTLRATLCYHLLRLSRPQPSDIVVDPLCGVASISIEGSMAYKDSYHICGDINRKTLEKGSINIIHAKEDNSGVKIDALRWDSTNLPLRDNSCDLFVTDLPFGKRSGNKKDNRVLYKKILTELARVVRVSTGRASVMTADRTAMNAACKSNQTYWKMKNSLTINQGGSNCGVYLLLRTDSPFTSP